MRIYYLKDTKEYIEILDSFQKQWESIAQLPLNSELLLFLEDNDRNLIEELRREWIFANRNKIQVEEIIFWKR